MRHLNDNSNDDNEHDRVLRDSECVRVPMWATDSMSSVARDTTSSCENYRMSALGHKRTCAVQKGMSALPPKADIRRYRIFAKSPCRPRPFLKRLAPATPSSISASRPLYHS